MTGDIYLGRLFGIPFRLHWSWFLAVILIASMLAMGFFPHHLPQMRDAPMWYWALGTLAALGLFASVLLHELGHAVVAKRFGMPVRGIRLFIFGGVMELGGEPKKPSHEILMALGGPAVTLVLIIVYGMAGGAILAATGVRSEPAEEGMTKLAGESWPALGAVVLLGWLAFMNGILLVFNMVPAFPLDGGRVFRGIVWAITGDYLTSTRVAGGMGIAFSWLLFFGGFLMALWGNLWGGLWFFFLAMFLRNAAQSSIAYAQLQELLHGVTVEDMMRRQPTAVDANQSLREVVDEFFLRYPYKAYPVMEDGRFVGILTLRALQEVDRNRWDTMRAGDLVAQRGALPVLRPDEPVLGAMRKLAESDQSRLPVVDNGHLIGLLCSRDIMDFLEIRTGLAVPRAETVLVDKA